MSTTLRVYRNRTSEDDTYTLARDARVLLKSKYGTSNPPRIVLARSEGGREINNVQKQALIEILTRLDSDVVKTFTFTVEDPVTQEVLDTWVF